MYVYIYIYIYIYIPLYVYTFIHKTNNIMTISSGDNHTDVSLFIRDLKDMGFVNQYDYKSTEPDLPLKQ